MCMKTIQCMFEHMEWANKAVVEALKNSQQFDGKLSQLLAHVFGAEAVWLTRLRGQDSSSLPIWPTWTIDQCIQAFDRNREGYREYISQLQDDDLDRVISYSNSQGTSFETSIRDILTHVALHGSYHRGQIASFMKLGGDAPVSTDYILYSRL